MYSQCQIWHLAYVTNVRGDLNAAVAATLNGERVAAGLTFEQLASKTGISARSLKRYLSGVERDIKVNTLAQIAGPLGLSLTEVIRRSELRREHRDEEQGQTRSAGG